jgi:hypothetical protein
MVAPGMSRAHNTSMVDIYDTVTLNADDYPAVQFWHKDD